MAIIYGRPDSEKRLLDLYPKQVKKIEDIETIHRKLKNELNAEGHGFIAGIRKWMKKRKINKFEKNKDNTLHVGAKGEILTLKKLSQLSNHYNILCGIQVILPRYVTYKGRKNLRTAQIDFIVVSKKGIILIEVKNWSNQYYNQQKGISPHEQVDRAGRVLWIKIKSRWGWWERSYPRVKSVLLSIKGNMRYDSNYKFVYVSDLHGINYFIENKKEELSKKEVKRVIKMLKNYVTN